MSESEKYNGWTNRETWAVALHINNDQGWQESVLETLREARTEDVPLSTAFQAEDVKWEAIGRAAEIIQESVENVLDPEVIEVGIGAEYAAHYVEHILPIRDDIGSLWRVNWTELGASFLEDLGEED